MKRDEVLKTMWEYIPSSVVLFCCVGNSIFCNGRIYWGSRIFAWHWMSLGYRQRKNIHFKNELASMLYLFCSLNESLLYDQKKFYATTIQMIFDGVGCISFSTFILQTIVILFDESTRRTLDNYKHLIYCYNVYLKGQYIAPF